MKTFFIFLALMLFPCFVHACDIEDVYLVDFGQSEFLGKMIGEYYQCVDVGKKEMRLYNRANPKAVRVISLNDPNFDLLVLKDNPHLDIP